MVFQVHGRGLLKSARRGVRRSQDVFFSAHWGVSPADMLLEFTVATLASQGGSPKWQGDLERRLEVCQCGESDAHTPGPSVHCLLQVLFQA